MLSVAAAIAACAASVPVLEQTRPEDDALTCLELERSIGWAVNVRAQAIEEAKLAAIDDMIGANDRSAQVVLGVVVFALPAPDAGIQHHDLAWHAAEARLHRLLLLKRNRPCPDLAVGDGEITERQLLEQLESVDRDTLAGNLSLRERADRRQELFDYYRVRRN